MSAQLPRVLVVDDVEANVIALEALLGQLPCQVDRAMSGNDALRCLLKHDYAMMLLDVQMPEMDGYEVATFARANPQTSEVPIIFVTAMHETMENALRGYGAGAVDFLFKPVNPVVLRSKVHVFLELYVGRRRLAEEITAHQAMLADLEAFNASVSHDLRAPLRPLEGFSRALLEDYGDKLDADATRYLERIEAAAKRMGLLIEDLLRLAHLGRGAVQRAPCDLAPIAAAVVAEQQALEPGRQVELVCPAELKVDGDGPLLRIVLENLLRNAWKFTRHAADARLEVGTKEVDGRTAYFVRDNGAGFDSAFAHRLFQPFQRLHTAAEFEGTGIGLAIVGRIIRRHGGKVWAESQPGHGATFFFTLDEPPAPR
ncbi:MAG: response regulator [Archangium sp.]|nr:response regulator [Archangium sp.]